jgi:hypothetical protein
MGTTIRFRFLLMLIVGILLGSADTASAAMFGKQEEIHKLTDVDITGQQGEPLYLGYKTTTLFIVAGLYITDDGYVFGVRDKSDQFISTTPEEIAKFQAQGLLPNPLPKYAIGMVDLLLGYSLWITLVIVAIVYGIGWLRKRGKSVDPAAPAPTASSTTRPCQRIEPQDGPPTRVHSSFGKTG